MKLPVVTEGPVNAKLLERLISCHPGLRGQDIKVIEKEGHSGVRSRAQTIQVLRGLPVAVVMDTDSEADSPYVQRWRIERWLGESAPSCEWRMVLFEPNAEAWLMRQRAQVPGLLPVEPSREQLERARTEPRQVLAELFAQAGEADFPQALLRRLGQVDLSPLWATRELRPLEEFLLEKLQPQPQEDALALL